MGMSGGVLNALPQVSAVRFHPDHIVANASFCVAVCEGFCIFAGPGNLRSSWGNYGESCNCSCSLHVSAASCKEHLLRVRLIDSRQCITVPF